MVHFVPFLGSDSGRIFLRRLFWTRGVGNPYSPYRTFDASSLPSRYRSMLSGFNTVWKVLCQL